MKKIWRGLLAVAAIGIAAPLASAAPIAIVCPGGPQALPAAPFGGSGIPNTDVCVTNTTVGGDILTLGLTATSRFDNLPAVTNDGVGTFTAPFGNDAAHGQPGYAQWNFDFYAHSASGGAGPYNLVLFYDFDPAVGTDESALGQGPATLLGGATIQDSWNLGMPFLGIPDPPIGSFNPNVGGQYTFALRAFDQANVLLAETAIQVQVGPLADPVPEPATLVLLGSGLLGSAYVRKRKKQPK
jgi:hypothetical protein